MLPTDPSAAPPMFPVPKERGPATWSTGDGLTNTLLAAALTAVGIPFDTQRGLHQVRGDGIASGGRFTYYFAEQSLDGRHKTAELIAAWENPKWHLANPEHPFAYIKCALLNRERLVDMIKQDSPLTMLRHHGKIALVGLHASQATQDAVQRRLTQRRNSQ